MKRLLCIVGSMNAGGAETFLMKIYRELDKEKYQMDFCVAEQKKNFYEDEIKKMGGKMYRIVPKSKNPIKNFAQIKKIVQEGKYNHVLRISQNSLSSIDLLAARLGGAQKLALRSSNSNNCGGKLNLFFHYLFRPISNRIANIKVAPSIEAAQYMFGNKNLQNGKVVFIHNALNFDDYKLNKQKRNQLREELNIDKNIVIGHVGRLNYQKNHKFLLNVFAKYHEIEPEAILICVGTGELKQELMEYTKKLQIVEFVKFLDARADVNELYSAMDLYVFPSLFEGMPNTVIEAQANGLDCIISSTITKEANITGCVKYLTLGNTEQWVEAIKNSDKTHKDYKECFVEKRYDIQSVVLDFIDFIIN